MIYQLLIDRQHVGYALADTTGEAIEGLRPIVARIGDGETHECEVRLLAAQDTYRPDRIQRSNA